MTGGRTVSRRLRGRSLGGLSWWTILAITSALLVFPTGLTLLFSSSLTSYDGLVYNTETYNWTSYRAFQPYEPCSGPYTPVVDYQGIKFQVGIRGVPSFPLGRYCANLTIFGEIWESGANNYTFRVPCTADGKCGPWISPDLLAGVRWDQSGQPFPSVILMASVTLIPGVPTYVGPAVFGAGGTGLFAYAVFSVMQFRRRRRQRSVNSPQMGDQPK
jgi:hypothetical protein